MVMFGTTRKAMKKWPHLSKEDAQLCWKVWKCPGHEEAGYLVEMIRQKRYDALKVVCGMSLSDAAFSAAFVQGWQGRDMDAITLLAPACAGELNATAQKELLVELVNSPDWTFAMPDAFKALKRVDVSYLVGWICRMDAQEQPRLFADLYKKRRDSYVDIVTNAMHRDIAVFDIALAAMPDTPDDPTYVARVGKAYLNSKDALPFTLFEKLIARGMYVSLEEGLLLKMALKRGRLDCAQALLDAGYDLRTLGQRVLDAVKGDAVRPDAVTFLEEKMGVALPKAAKNAVVDGFRLLATDTVGRTLPMPDGGHLSIVFNFTLRQQIVVSHPADENGAPSAPSVVPFDTLGAGDGVQAAAQALIALGGDAARANDATRGGARQILLKQPARGEG